MKNIEKKTWHIGKGKKCLRELPWMWIANKDFKLSYQLNLQQNFFLKVNPLFLTSKKNTTKPVRTIGDFFLLISLSTLAWLLGHRGLKRIWKDSMIWNLWHLNDKYEKMSFVRSWHTTFVPVVNEKIPPCCIASSKAESILTRLMMTNTCQLLISTFPSAVIIIIIINGCENALISLSAILQ